MGQWGMESVVIYLLICADMVRSGRRAPAQFWSAGNITSHGNGHRSGMFEFARCAKKTIFNSFTSFSRWNGSISYLMSVANQARLPSTQVLNPCTNILIESIKTHLVNSGFEALKLDLRLALLQRWHTPRLHISTTSSLVLALQSHTLPMSHTRVFDRRVGSSSTSMTKRARASQSFMPGSDCKTLVTFSKLATLRWKRLLVGCWMSRLNDERALPKTFKMRKEVLRGNQGRKHWAKQEPCQRGLNRSLGYVGICILTCTYPPALTHVCVDIYTCTHAHWLVAA